MASLVITDAGISLQSFQELRDDLKKEWEAAFGDSIDLSPTSVDGHHIDLECKTITSISQLLQAVIDNFDPSKATGVWLDILGDYKSMERIKATYSVATVTFIGESGTVVPSGTVVRYSGAPCDFVLQDDVTIGESGSVDGSCIADVIGNIEVFVGDWQMVSTSPDGVSCKVKPENEGGAGLNDETDAEFRSRQKKFSGSGLATYDKMYAYMASVVGEGNFSLQVNDEDVEKDGIPPHRFEFVFRNGIGTNDELAQAVWHCKPGGIKPFGNTSGIAKNIVNVKHTMYFSRPVNAKLWVSVSITEYTEESLPNNYAELISQAIANYAASELSPGKDVIPKRFYGPVYDAVKGVEDIVVKVCIKDTEPDVSEYSEDVIEVPPQTIAVVQKVSVVAE